MGKSPKREVDETTASWSYAELWDRFPIPARPDEEEITLEERAMTGAGLNPEEIRVMILGSTIEYRSLCKRLGVTPHVVDFSQENFDSLSSYSKEKFTSEHFVEADWLQIDFTDFFDFILGHRPFNVIRHDQVVTLFQKMHAALKPGGVFFCRGNVKFPDHVDQLDTLVKTWAFAPNRPYRLFSYLEVALYMHCADDQGYLDYPKAREVIQSYANQGLISEADFKDILPLISMPAGTKFRSFVLKEELEEAVQAAGFSNVEWLFTSHAFTKNMPILKLTR